MFMRTRYLADIEFNKRYDWASHKTDRPAPEAIIFTLFGKHLKLMPWRVFRGHGNCYTFENIKQLDWITHAHDPAMYDRFMEFEGPLPVAPVPTHYRSSQPPRIRPHDALLRRQWEAELQKQGVKA